MKINKYPDGNSYIELPVHSEPQPFTFRLNSYEDLWHLNQIVECWNSWYKMKPVITIPCLIDGQADKRFANNQSSGLKLVCQFLNNMNANFKIFHPHNPEVVEALMDNVEIIDNTYFIKEVLSIIYCKQNNIKRDKGIFYHVNHNLSNLILMSSDAGGFKPLMKLCDKINWKGETYSASKARSWDENDGTKFIQQIGRKDFGGKDILIIDDISVYGGTFKGLAKILHECNVGKLYLAVSHITVQNLGEDPFTNYFDTVFTTNSKHDFYGFPSKDNVSLEKPKNLEIIKLF